MLLVAGAAAQTVWGPFSVCRQGRESLRGPRTEQDGLGRYTSAGGAEGFRRVREDAADTVKEGIDRCVLETLR